jgi:serine/threonine-protein kinase HipA
MVQSGGQFILKPRPLGGLLQLEAVPINEHLTMQVARQVFGMETAACALVAFQGGELAYLARRFDVLPDGGRLLQEDFAQIAGRSGETHGENYKYDSSYEEIGELIRRHVAAYAIDLEHYFKLVVFNYVVNNGDAHIKNFSLIRSEATGEYSLSPAYDLLNTRLHLPNETQTALELFKDGFETKSFQLNAFYARDDFVEFARRLGLVEKRVLKILESFAALRPAVFALIDSSLLTLECKRLYKEHIRDRIKAIAHSHSGVRRKRKSS